MQSEGQEVPSIHNTKGGDVVTDHDHLTMEKNARLDQNI